MYERVYGGGSPYESDSNPPKYGIASGSAVFGRAVNAGVSPAVSLSGLQTARIQA
jgi:hypothetical protein